jgi:hypothetical protein
VVRRFDTDPHVTPFLKALNTLRREATRQRAFTEHVATIIAMVDQYAESAMGDRHYFCEQPYVLPPGSRCHEVASRWQPRMDSPARWPWRERPPTRRNSRVEFRAKSIADLFSQTGFWRKHVRMGSRDRVPWAAAVFIAWFTVVRRSTFSPSTSL